jgi:hypothetical protein
MMCLFIESSLNSAKVARYRLRNLNLVSGSNNVISDGVLHQLSMFFVRSTSIMRSLVRLVARAQNKTGKSNSSLGQSPRHLDPRTKIFTRQCTKQGY